MKKHGHVKAGLIGGGCLLLAIFASPGAQAQMSGLFQWKDAQGITHFSDRPPENGVKFEKRGRIKPGSESTDDSDADSKNKEAKGKGTKTEEDAKRAASAEKEREENCKRAKNALSTLESGRRISTVNDKGETVYLDESALEKEREFSRKSVESWCETPKAK